MAYDASLLRQLRLLINDTGTGDAQVFTDVEISDFLDIEGGSLKRAAAQAIDTIADNEALVAKVITDHQLSTQGDRTAVALRARANTLREQAALEDTQGAEDGGSFFDEIGVCARPIELADFDWFV